MPAPVSVTGIGDWAVTGLTKRPETIAKRAIAKIFVCIVFCF
jgi:hypothetical protein